MGVPIVSETVPHKEQDAAESSQNNYQNTNNVDLATARQKEEILGNAKEVAFVLDRCGLDPRPYVTININGKDIVGLLDSGATQTIIGKEGLFLIENTSEIRPMSDRFVETADARKHKVEGVIDLPMTLEDRTRNIATLVVPTLPQRLILGINFWTQMQMVTDMSNKTWEFAASKDRVALLDGNEGIQGTRNLPPDQKNKLDTLIEHYLKEENTTLGRTTLVEHVIDTGDAKPIKQRYYNLSPARQKLLHAELDRMLDLKVVEPSKSAWSSPVILLDKPDGSHRWCLDLRKVNEVTKRDAYPLPQVTSILDRLRDAKYLSSLDVKHAYWQIPLSAESKDKTAFTIPGRGLFHFVTMPFGLHNAPATWQRFIDNVLGADLEPQVFVYLDDIIVVTQTYEEHLRILEEIFKRLRAAQITLNKSKCKFCRSELKYLGYIVDETGLKVDPEKVRAIMDIPVPKTPQEVRRFCGMASWYRRFIPNFATRLQPLTNLLRKKKVPFKWSTETQDAFMDIRNCLVKSPILTCPDFSKEFIISTDASGVGIGAVLSQNTEVGEVVVAYASRTLSRGEMIFSATERECLSVIWAIERFRPYVKGTTFNPV